MSAHQLADDSNTDAGTARFICYSMHERLSAMQMVIIECPSGRRFLGLVEVAGLNIERNALDPMDNTSLNQIELIACNKLERSAAIREAWLYRINLLKDVTDGVQSIQIRPQTTAKARPASDEEIVRYLMLPAINESTAIGNIFNTSVPICVSRNIFAYQIFIVGSIGSGKTNTIANLLAASNALGSCNIIWDHKPDYQDVHLANDDPEAERQRSLEDVVYYAVGRNTGINKKEHPIWVRSSDLDPEMLAATIFHRPGEELQRDSAEVLLVNYYEQKQGSGTIDEFRKWVMEKGNTAYIHKATLTAIQNKVMQKRRLPYWIDAGVTSTTGTMHGPLAGSDPEFDLEQLIAPGKTLVIRVGSDVSDGRSYGLLLSYVMKRVYALKEAKKLNFPINNFIDEAQDIFNAGKAFRDVAESMLDMYIRKGRSQGIGFIISVQAADAVPDRILNNLNTRIILRHNSGDQIKVAANMASEEQRRMTSTFGCGEALVFLIGSNSIVHARLWRSPFKLTKHDL